MDELTKKEQKVMDKLKGKPIKKEEKFMDRVMKIKPIQRSEAKTSILEALKMTWYLDGWISKIVFVIGGFATLYLLVRLIGWIF